MGKSKTKAALKKVFKDITNLAEEVIQDSKNLRKCIKDCDFNDKVDANKVFQDSKIVIERLKEDVVKITECFDETYNAWQGTIDDVNNKSKDTESSTNEINQSDIDDTNDVIETSDKSSNGVVEHVYESNANEVSNETCNVMNGQNDNVTEDVTDEIPDTAEAATVNDNTAANFENIPEVTETNAIDDDTEKNAANGSCEKNDNVPDDIDNVNDIVYIDANGNENESNEDTDMTAEMKNDAKVFLKCIDINKLKAIPTSDANDSVLIISDSEPEKDEDCFMSKSLRTKSRNGTIDAIALGIGQEITISKIKKPSLGDKDDVQIVENEDSNISNRTISTDNVLKSNAILTTGFRKRCIKDSLKISGRINTDSSSESDTSHRRKQLKRLMRKLPKPSKQELRVIAALDDKKFSYKAYVPLPRYPCGKLKALYLNKLDHNQLKRLTNLDILKKRKRDKCKGSDSSSSEKGKKRGKSNHLTSNDSESSKNSDNDCSDGAAKKLSLSTECNTDPTKVILNDVSSATDASVSEDNKSKKKKKKQKSKKASKKMSSDEDSDNKNKKKWHSDKLLRKKILDSDSDSGDEGPKSENKREKSKSMVKTRLAKRRAKKVIDSSDSSSQSDSKKKSKKKKQSESSSVPSSTSSSSSSSDSDSDKRPKKETAKPKKGGRIKRTKDSSSNDDDKTTRKSIRRVKGHEELRETTKQAEKEEIERKARIVERQKKYNTIFDADKPADSTVDKVVLDFDEDGKNELLSVEKDLVSKLKPHQAKGIHFMWDACYESISRTQKTNGSGCILAHCMGLGKTLQVIALIHTLITNKEKTNVEKVLVVCPVNTVLNWVEEFQKWLDDLEGDTIEVYELVSNRQNSYREYTVKRWNNHGGVLIIGYDMFRNLTNPTNKRLPKRMRESFQTAMINPGPDLIICDEGHLLKNEKTHLNVAISRVRTERRIVLTGTPMQNNLKEYYCMVQFVKPNLLGTYKEYLNRFVNPITNGQYTDSTARDISVMKKRSHVLHKMLDGVVQRKDYNVLAPFLPPKHEYVLFTKLSEVQILLYQFYLDNLARRPVNSKIRKTAFLFSDFQEIQRICTHPRVLLLKSIENRKKAMFEVSDESEGSLKDFIDDKSEKSTTPNNSSSSSSSDSENSDASTKNKNSGDENVKKKKPNKRMTRTAAAAAGVVVDDIADDIPDDKDEFNNWWKKIVDGDELENIALGQKLYLLFEILRQCELIGDKILVFSQSLYSLNIIEYFLGKIDQATQDGKGETVCDFSGSWALGLDYFRIDGSSSCDNRAAWCKSFNNPDNLRARLFLISTKAGGLGINLFGANRVIIFDVSWNPSHDTQSIYRVYRFGQIKPCYIYRFVTWGTMEMKIYERQVTKQAISKRVIDEQQIDRHYNQNDLAELYNFDPKPAEASTPLLPKDILLAELLQKEKDRIYKYHEHQTLLENKEEEELDEAERKAAWEEYEHEKTNPPASTAGLAAAGGWIKNLPLTSIQAALLNIIQKDNPTWTREQVQAVIPIVIQQLREQTENGELLLFNRIVNELKIMQVQQQKKLQEYYMQQQLRMLKQQQQLFAGAQKQSMMGSAQNSRSHLNQINPNEIVELND